ncbi:hypothetical protein [Flavobacterium sp. N3904]|uniref:hypothetical protein n=1 Tax=Flavobacterium sp. N3904 TaxID=2986835 RepID=UPI002224F84C|nr:hypothetical protein [Flavobacterium sp. N3904]
MTRILFFLMVLLNFNSYSQAIVKELYEYDVNDNLIKKDENLKFWLDNLSNNVYYVGHNFSQSYKHDQTFTKFNLIKKGTKNSVESKDTILITIPKSPLKLSFQTIEKTARGNVTQDILVEYNLPFYSFNHGAFDPNTFQYKTLDYFLLGLKAYRINNGQLIANVLNRMVDDNYQNKMSKFDILINDINKSKKYNVPLLLEKEQNIEGVIWALGKVSNDIPTLMYDVYIHNKKSEEKSWANMQEFFNFNNDNIKKYLNDQINDYLILKMEKPELLLFPRDWIKEKQNVTAPKSTPNSLHFNRVTFRKNQSEHCFEITFEITNAEQVQWCFGFKEGYVAKKGKTGITKATLENPILITPEEVKIYVYTDRIKGVLTGSEYEKIELFNSKLSFN